MDRRLFLQAGGFSCLAAALPRSLLASIAAQPLTLTAKPTQTSIVGPDWLFHCHALEHHAAGLGALVRIT